MKGSLRVEIYRDFSGKEIKEESHKRSGAKVEQLALRKRLGGSHISEAI